MQTGILKRAGNLYSYLEYLAQFRRRYNAPIVSLSGFALAAFLGVSLADFNETH
ncbi:hypothetical protein PR646_002029 [Campylobacter coli]|nr:hypothetical protein [Campylobacter coli]EKL5124235.1 hypothetical protein [Campylobacter coli]